MENKQFNIGIYQIVNLLNGKRYIGSAIRLNNRKRQHLKDLEKNIHRNQPLQRSYNKYGKENFKFEILLYCSKEDLIFYEQRAIDAYDFKTLYNIAPKAGSQLGFKHSKENIENHRLKMTGRKLTEEHKKTISQSHLGKKKSISHTENIRKAKLKDKNPLYIHFTKEQIQIMIKMRKEGLTYDKIAVYFGCAHSTIGLRFKEINKHKNKNKNKTKKSDRILFTQNQLNNIKKLRDSGLSLYDIGKKFNCSSSVIKSRLENM